MPSSKIKRKEQRTRRLNRKRQLLRDYKLAHPCACGESDPICLDFHHRNPNDKGMEIGDIRHSTSLTAIAEELTKCDVMCANCHRKHHCRTELDAA